MRALLASPLGLLVGISLGALGGGGSILAVPALVYAAGQSPKTATTTSLVMVAVTALIGIVPYWRAHYVRFGTGTIFGLAGIGGSIVGSRWNDAADPDVLLLAFSVLMLVAAFGMWRRIRTDRTETIETIDRTETIDRSVGAAVATPAAGHTRIDPMTVAQVATAGTVVGLMTGFFGVGGGFVIVPALVLTLGFTMPQATGTSLLVIAINSAVALTTRLDSASIQWGTVVPFTIASLLGVVVGSQLARRHDATALQRWFVGLLVVVGLYTFAQSALAL